MRVKTLVVRAVRLAATPAAAATIGLGLLATPSSAQNSSDTVGRADPIRIGTPATATSSSPASSRSGTTDSIRPFEVRVPEEELVEPRNLNLISAVEQKTHEIKVPVAIPALPDEVIRVQEAWARRAFPTLTYFNEADRGGHFAMWEYPELFATELRAAFRSLR